MLGRILRDNLKEDYLEMLKKVEGKFSYDLTGFAPLVGSQYDESFSRLLVCGRAVSGWRNCINSDSSSDELMEKILAIPDADIEVGCDMNWLNRSREKWKSTKGEDGYKFKKSPFWSSAFDVLSALEGSKVDLERKICWSNVYKVSPPKGNPGQALRHHQIDNCSTILQKEIDILKPKHILFVTGGWGKVILKRLGIGDDYKSEGNVHFNGQIEGIKVLVASRPEGKKRRKWVAEVLEGFNSIA